MDIKNRKMLKHQLENQAQQFLTEQDDGKLIQSVLASCSALLRAAEKELPENISEEEADALFAGYAGISKKVNDFYTGHADYMRAGESQRLQSVMKSLKTAEIEKKELDKNLEGKNRELETLRKETDANKIKLTEAEKNRKQLEDEKTQLNNQLTGTKNRIAEIEREKKQLQNETETLEPNIDRLIAEVADIRETYDDMRAYYSELDRMMKGMEEEGFVDMKSFVDKIASMNQEGKDLMQQYDDLLKKLSSDVATLQDKIDTRRKANGAV